MEHEEIMALCQKTGDEKYAKYLADEGWKYETEEDARAGYRRMTKSQSGTPLTLKEFLAELRMEDAPSTTQQLYHTLLGLVKTGALSPYDVYHYARYHWCIRCPEAVIAYEIGPKRWAVNNCAETITEDRAKLLLNADFGFEASRIKLLGTPYYDASDWNFICFRCGPYDWLMRNGDLHQIYQ